MQCITCEVGDARPGAEDEVAMPRIVITGAPGAGKTTLLLALQERGYTIVSDRNRKW